MQILHAPTPWRNVNLRNHWRGDRLAVQIENPTVCVLAQAPPSARATPGDIVFVSISDGVGVGVMVTAAARTRSPVSWPRAVVARCP